MESVSTKTSKLYVVPTPVGNMEDMTFRAVRVLKEADLILAEDTRTSGVLMQHYDIHGTLMSHHKFNEHETVQQVVQKILGGLTVALISDAGTPGISDPGFLLVRECVKHGIEVLLRGFLASEEGTAVEVGGFERGIAQHRILRVTTPIAEDLAAVC